MSVVRSPVVLPASLISDEARRREWDAAARSLALFGQRLGDLVKSGQRKELTNGVARACVHLRRAAYAINLVADGNSCTTLARPKQSAHGQSTPSALLRPGRECLHDVLDHCRSLGEVATEPKGAGGLIDHLGLHTYLAEPFGSAPMYVLCGSLEPLASLLDVKTEVAGGLHQPLRGGNGRSVAADGQSQDLRPPAACRQR